jgi:hypothetical protein
MIVTISARTALAALCCLVLEIPGSWAQSPLTRATTVDMQAGQSYRAGTRVRVPNGVASFLIPTGWRGEQLDNLAAVLLVSEKESGFVLAFAILNQTEDELFALLGEPQPISETLVFEPTGTVTRKDSKLTATYVAGSLTGRGMAIMGPDLQGILFLHARPQKEPSITLSLLDQLTDHVQFIPAMSSSPSP